MLCSREIVVHDNVDLCWAHTVPRSYDWADKVLKHLAGASQTHNGDRLRVTHRGSKVPRSVLQ